MAAADGASQGLAKYFVLDTNVLLHNPNALFAFHDNHVIIPFMVIEELDRFKTENNDIGRNARQCIRNLDRLRLRGRLVDGVEWSDNGNGHGGTIRIDINQYDLPPALRDGGADNRIIGVALQLKDQGHRTIFISKDLNARIKSDALGIQTEDYEKEKVDADHLYTGYTEITLPGEIIDELYSERMLPMEKLDDYLVRETATGDTEPIELAPNQFILMRDLHEDSHTGLARRLADTEHCIPVSGPRRPVFGILPRNAQQTMALDLLLDDEVKLITLLGMAGTGKTLIAIAAGMLKTLNEERYDKLLVARPIMPMGRDIGYLPGDKDEKLAAWMQPIFDNLAYLLSTRGSSFQTAESYSPEQRIQKLMADGKLVLEPLTYIRGRSIPHQFMVVDEAQNLTPHEVKTIASRVGDGTKLILTGDIAQIDNPYLDSSSNGLSYLVERLKGESIVGHITLAKSERSELASLAAERL
jgi:PhoH-like ATPase